MSNNQENNKEKIKEINKENNKGINKEKDKENDKENNKDNNKHNNKENNIGNNNEKNNKENQKDINEANKSTSRDNFDMSIKKVLRNKRISIVKPKEDQILDLVRDELEEGTQIVENPKLLLYFLLNTPVFKQYTYVHHFTKENLINSFRFGRYVRIKKDTILFKQGDKTDKFYLILSGCIGFILTTYEDNILKKNPYSREVNSIKVGSYFGEWGFIYRISRTVSAYAKEDTLLLGFDKFAFKTFYQDNIICSENNAKKFILKHIKTFKELNETSFNVYYREVKKIFCIPGQEIFLEGNNADSFYLVYMGSCVIKKGLTNLIIKDSGDFIGIESLFKDKYQTNIYPYTEGTVLFKFLLNIFNENIIMNLRIEFEAYYKKQVSIIKNFNENYNRYKEKYQMSFVNLLENLKKNKSKNNKKINNISIDEIRVNYNMIKKKQYSSPYSTTKYCHLVNINNNKLNTHRLESTNNNFQKKKETPFFKDFRPSNETSKKLINIDINNTNSGINLDTYKSRNKKINMNFIKKISDINIRPYSSLNRVKYDKNIHILKKNFDYFNEDNSNNNSKIKSMKRDNHFSNQNFKLMKKQKNLFIKSKNKMIKNKSINNITNKKYFQPKLIATNKNYLELNRNKGNINIFKKNYTYYERNKTNYKRNEIQKNIEHSNNEIPLMIIRNVSFYGSKIKNRRNNKWFYE